MPEFMLEGLKTILESHLLGYFCIYVKGEGNEIIEVGVIQKFPATVSLLMNRKDILGLRIKFAKEILEFENSDDQMVESGDESLGKEFDFIKEL